MRRLPVVLVGLVLGCGGAPSPQPEARVPSSKVPVPPAPDAGASVAKASYVSRFPEVRVRDGLPKADGPRLFFTLGAGDARLGEYREVEIVTGEPWSGGGTAHKFHAWVLPKDKFAVGWNGLVYPVVKVGERADLTADVQALIAKEDKERAAYAKDHAGSPYRNATLVGEESGLSEASLNAPKVAMLALLGKNDLAEALRTRLFGTEPADKVLETFAGDYLWARFERAVTAHMRGDAELAYESLKGLADAADDADRACDAAGSKRPEKAQSRFRWGTSPSRMLEDSERRLLRGPRAPLDLEALAKQPASAQVPILIDHLDEVAERQWGQPGGVSLGSSPIVAALVKLGDAAVPALLDVLESDTRLTRSMHFWRDFARSRSVLGAHEAAYAALIAILDFSPFQTASTGDDLSQREDATRKKLAAEVRAFAAKWKGVSQEERWFGRLADDATPAAGWLEAAAAITRTTNHQRIRSTMFGGVLTMTPLVPGSVSKVAGEALRTKRAPSVADLLEKRGLAEQSAGDANGACTLSLALAEWEPTTANTQRVLAAHLRSLSMPANGRAPGFENARCIVELSRARFIAGDTSALADFGSWVSQVAPPQGAFDTAEVVLFLGIRPADPDLAKAAEAMFKAGSPWLPLVSTTKGSSGPLQFALTDILRHTDLLALPAFRRLILRELANATPMGTIKVGTNQYQLQMVSGGSTSAGVQNDDSPKALPAPMEVRVADYIADGMFGQGEPRKDVPRFHMYWPKAKRDAALPTLRAWVQAIK